MQLRPRGAKGEEMSAKYLTLTRKPEEVAFAIEAAEKKGYEFMQFGVAQGIGFGATIAVVMLFKLRNQPAPNLVAKGTR